VITVAICVEFLVFLVSLGMMIFDIIKMILKLVHSEDKVDGKNKKVKGEKVKVKKFIRHKNEVFYKITKKRKEKRKVKKKNKIKVDEELKK